MYRNGRDRSLQPVHPPHRQVWECSALQEHPDHLLYLFLLGLAIADNRLLHLHRRIFRNWEPALDCDQDEHPLAWDTDIAVVTFRLKNNFSKATASGSYLSISPHALVDVVRLSSSGVWASVWIQPYCTGVTLLQPYLQTRNLQSQSRVDP